MERKGIHVLLVDDEPMIRETFEFNLREMGYTVTVAESGNHAAQILDSENISIVVSDINMPNGNGLHLRDRLTSKDTPIIVMTGYQTAYLPHLTYETILEKPISFDVLDKAILECLSKRSAERAS